MRKSLSRQRVAQFKLFHPPQKSPSWQMQPPDTKRKTVKLLARLLREHIGRVHAFGSRKGAGDEQVRFLASGVAIVDGSWTITGAKDANGKPLPLIRGRACEIVQKKRGRWRFVATREMVVWTPQ